MAVPKHNKILLILTGLICSAAGQDKAPQSVPADSAGALDSIYTAFIEHGPTIEFQPLFIKTIWILIIAAAGIFTWHYLLRPLILFVTEKRMFKNQIIISGRLVILLLTLYLIFTEIFNPAATIATIILASAGLCAALAAKEVLHDFLSGLIIVYNHTFKTGDYLLLPESTGKVIKTGLISTLVNLKNGETRLYPNHKIIGNTVSKLDSDNPIAAIEVYFYLARDIDTVTVKEIAQRSSSLSRYIYLNKPITVEFSNILHDGASILQMKICASVLHIDYADQFKSDITENVLRELYLKNILPTVEPG
jgi:MscS family membrane protein